MLRTSVTLPSWIQGLITIDRLLFVIYPNRFKLFRRKIFISAIIACVALSSALLNLPSLWFELKMTEHETIRRVNSTWQSPNCETILYEKITFAKQTCTASREMRRLRDKFGVIFRTILPFTIILVSNSWLIKKFIASKQKMHRLSSHSSLQQQSNLISGESTSIVKSPLSREYQFIFSVIVIDILFLIILLPLPISGVFFYLYTNKYFDHNKKRIATVDLLYNFFYYLSACQFLLPFLVNLLFNKIFKAELVKIYHELKPKSRNVS